MPEVGCRDAAARVATGLALDAGDGVHWLLLDVLAAVDLDLGAADIACAFLAQEVDDISHFVWRAQAAHRDLLLDDLLGAGRQDRGVDLAWRDGIDANAARPEVMGH